jgi:hypothetical protein
MEQTHTSLLARWMSPPLPGLELVGWPRQRALVLAQLWPVFGVLLLLCALLWGIGQYAGYKTDLRRAETGRYLAQFQEPPVIEAWQHLNSVWRSEERRQEVLLERVAGLSGAELAAASAVQGGRLGGAPAGAAGAPAQLRASGPGARRGSAGAIVRTIRSTAAVMPSSAKYS